MKKKLSLCFTLLIASLLAIICAFKFSPSSRDSKPEDTSDLKRTNFVNRLAPSQDFALQLFYANAGMSQIESFTLTSNTLTKDMVKLSPYSEGFLSQSKNDRLLKAVNAIRTTKKQRALSYFYHYQELGDYAFVSTSEGLDGLYFINLNTLDVYLPTLKDAEASLPQYVYAVNQVDGVYAILTAGVNELSARLYTFSPSTLELTLIASTITDTTALSSKQYTLTREGEGLLTHEKGIEVLSKTDRQIINLAFTPQMLISNNYLSSALAIEEDTLYYALIDDQLQIIDTGALTLPNMSLTLIGSFIDDDLLYTITYDPAHPTYRHYISIYNLLSKSLIFCEGLSTYNDLILLNISHKTMD